MNGNNKSVNMTIPVSLSNRVDRECDKNGYSKSFAGKVGLFKFVEMTHEERIKTLQRLDEYNRSVKNNE